MTQLPEELLARARERAAAAQERFFRTPRRGFGALAVMRVPPPALDVMAEAAAYIAADVVQELLREYSADLRRAIAEEAQR